MRRNEFIGVAIIFLLAIVFFFWNQDEKRKLDKRGVFIIGKLFSSDNDGEIGWVYKYKYAFDGKLYFRKFTGPLSQEIKNDSLLFFKILPDHPEICRQVSDIKVPKCIGLKDIPKNGWKNIPDCNSK